MSNAILPPLAGFTLLAVLGICLWQYVKVRRARKAASQSPLVENDK